MRYIDKEEYDRLFAEFIQSSEDVEVENIEDTWDWWSEKQKEFEKKLSEEGIAKQK